MGLYRDDGLFLIGVGPIRDIQVFSLNGFMRTLDTNILKRAPKANQVQVGDIIGATYRDYRVYIGVT